MPYIQFIIFIVSQKHLIFFELKGDTDTNAAILGGLFGAKYGFEKLCLEQKNNIDLMINNNPKLKDIDVIALGLYELSKKK